jgi:hypothetical protein
VAGHRVRLSGGNAWSIGLRSRAVGRMPMSALEIATALRALNHTLLELGRAVDDHDTARVDEFVALAWHQAADVPQSKSRTQRAELAKLQSTVEGRPWQERARLRTATDQSSNRTPSPAALPVRALAVAPRPRTARNGETTRLDAGCLLRIATELRPVLIEVAREGTLVTWPQLRRRKCGLPRLHRDDLTSVLWLVDEDREVLDEPRLSALVTVADRRMHPSFAEIARRSDRDLNDAARVGSVWSLEVLKTHQHWRHRRG